MQMNEVRRGASGSVQRRVARVGGMIDEPGHPAGYPRDFEEETTMLKTISAALLAVTVLAAPALAANRTKTTQPPVIKAVQMKASVLNANARMGHHHHRHHRHHRFH
jgi:hypothetical protein